MAESEPVRQPEQPPMPVRHSVDFLTGNPNPPAPDPDPEPGPPPEPDDGMRPGDVSFDADGHGEGFDPELPVGNVVDGRALYRRYADGKVYAGDTNEEWSEEHERLLAELDKP